METKSLSFEEVVTVLKELKVPENVDREYIYEIYDAVISGINNVMETVPSSRFVPVNHVVVLLYIIHEYFYSIQDLDEQGIIKLKEDNDLSSGLASICCDKYFTNEQLNYQSPVFLSKFNPQISTLNLYLNFNLNTIDKIKIASNDGKLYKKMLSKSFTLGKSILELLINGFETEAFSTWRTLHESECILFCLVKYGGDIVKDYFRHITYALAYRGQMSQDEQDKIFVEIKETMKNHDLKSKDMKKFIEYGYLYAIKDFDEQGLKLNFRDGVQKAAGLSAYSKTYEMSSEIAHSSALLLFSESGHFSNLTLINLYESFFRLESVFDQLLKMSLSINDYKTYSVLKSVYMNQLKTIYNRQKEKFLSKKA